MRENYKAWSVDKNKFPENGITDQLYFLINYAILAPSSHNSQPWRFEVGKDHVDIFLEESRLIPVGDPENRLAHISLGGAVEHILLCGSALGLKLSLSPGHLSNRVFRIIFEGYSTPAGTWVLDVVTKRVSNRYAYKSDSVSMDFISQMSTMAPQYNSQLINFDNKAEKEKIANITVASSASLMDSSEFRAELSRHVHSNVTGEKVGMPAFGMGIPTPPSFLVPFLLKHFNMQKISAKKDIDILVRQTPSLVILSTERDLIMDWLSIGRMFSYLALSGVKEGLQVAPWGSATVTKDAREELKDRLGLKNTPQFMFRIGIPTKETPHSPRFTVEEVTNRV